MQRACLKIKGNHYLWCSLIYFTLLDNTLLGETAGAFALALLLLGLISPSVLLGARRVVVAGGGGGLLLGVAARGGGLRSTAMQS